jgi:hypothetical protein
VPPLPRNRRALVRLRLEKVKIFWKSCALCAVLPFSMGKQSGDAFEKKREGDLLLG